jgi:hypothetical protein
MGLFVIVFDKAGKIIFLRQQFPGQVPVIVTGMHQGIDHGRPDIVSGGIAGIDCAALAQTDWKFSQSPCFRGFGLIDTLAAERAPG